LAGLTLLGVVRRTLMLERFGEPRPGGSGSSSEPRPGGSGLGRAATPLALHGAEGVHHDDPRMGRRHLFDDLQQDAVRTALLQDVGQVEKTDEFASEPAFQFFACSSASLRLKKANQ